MDPGSMRKRTLGWLLALVAAALATLAIYAWSQHRAREEAERRLGLDATRVLAEHFSKRGDIRVARLSGQVIARGEDEGFLGIVPSEQTTRVPFTVDYFVDASSMGAQSYRWDEETRTLTIDIPDVRPAKPNIDEAAGNTEQKGVYISRRASLDLAREISQRAAARSAQAAQRPDNMDKARANARAVVARMAQGSLAAVGMDDVRIAVSFPWEPKQPSDGEQWDVSRRMEDVLNKN